MLQHKHVGRLFFAFVTLSSEIVFANETNQDSPFVSGEAVVEIQIEHGTASDDQDNERTNLFARSEVAPTLQINEQFFLDGVLVFEPIKDSGPGEDSYFEKEGVFIEEIKLNFEKHGFSFFAGKFNPNFGTAWDYGRGIWGEDFAEDYEITEKIGLGVAYTFDTAEYGSHSLSLSTFFADTSFLSQSLFTSRGRVRKSSGGASNTEDFSSFTVSLDGEDSLGIENLSYHAAFRYLAKGDADDGGKDEHGIALALNYLVEVLDIMQSDILLEIAKINKFDSLEIDGSYYTVSIVNTIRENWDLTIAFTKREIEIPSGDLDDHLLQVSAGYDFENGLKIELGWRNSEESGIDTNIIGALARYTKEF